MAKPNVHTASRDELVEAGIRAELADEILKLRRKGKIDLEALDEVQGVGPATLEQLRKVLDFRDQPKNEDDRSERGGKDATGKATEAGKRTVDRAAETTARVTNQLAEVGKHTVNQAVETGKNAADQMVEIGARSADQVAETGKRTVDQASEVTRELADRAGTMVQQGLQLIQGRAGAARELPREVARRSTERTAEIGRTLLSLAHEQTRQNLHTLNAIAAAIDWNKAVQAVDWERVIQLQGELLQGSLDRSAQLTQRYLEVSQALMTATTSAARQQTRKAA
jgi:hypothetical protein